MMITIKNQKEINLMKESGKKHLELTNEIKQYIVAGSSTMEIETRTQEICARLKVIPAQIGYLGYKYATCIGINDDAEHCVPSKLKIIKEGDIVTYDTTIKYNGYHSDGGFTVGIGKIDKTSQRLIDTTQLALQAAINACIDGNYVNDISKAIYSIARLSGFDVLKDFTGHGIGKGLHEDPYIFNYPQKRSTAEIKTGMCFALDTMIAEGTGEVYMLDDGWSTKTEDGKRFAFFEKTVLINGNTPEILN